jgi:O-antigen/teichoic acid export membrane protein
MIDHGRLLRATLTVNAVSSGLCGAALLAGAAPLAALFGLEGPGSLAVFGALLAAFALYVWRARKEPLDRRHGWAIFVMDVGYVAASVAFLVGWPSVLSPLGRVATALVADLVAVFAVLEYVGLRRLRRVAAAAA